ncbi:MAG TPA: L,D-transpeptidase family protein [Vicinamibacterales bacterium]|nr:L,D-transpeptidase family protein [Vicinamibacterales bacterium]
MGTLMAISCSGQSERDASRQAAAELQRTLAGRAPTFITAHHDGPRIWKTLRAFYAERRYQPAWIDGTVPRPQLDALLSALDGADRHGLDPELYDLGPLSQARAQVRRRLLGRARFEPGLVAPVDLRLSAAWLAYASDLANGVTERPHADPAWRIRPRTIDLLPLLRSALDGNRVEETVRELAPSNDAYRRLADAREKYREIEKAGGWPRLPQNLRLRRGQRSLHLAALAKRLAASGDLPAGGSPPGTYDGRLQDAVRRFQARHGIEPDAAIGRETVTAMNVPVSTRIRQIELNMERWRWFPRDLGPRHIRVNVPEYRLEVRDSGRTVMEMRVVVGAKETPTPIFSDSMTTLVFAPFWNVPDSIATDETLPAMMSDPDYLARNNIEIVSTSGEVVDPSTIDWFSAMGGDEFPYRFRQRPGTTNSLGLVKFLFPNDFDVYLHDTPARTLFGRSYRALSHGCVRVEDPVKLAEYLLANRQDWDSARIQQAMQGDEERHVKLPHPVPVHLMYWTARVDDGGSLLFFADLYGHDARQWSVYQARIDRVRKQRAKVPAPVATAPSPSGASRPSEAGASVGPRVPRAGTASR